MDTRDFIEPHLWVDDLDTARRFYEHALGFDVRQSHPPDVPTWFQMARGTARIMLAAMPDRAHATGSQACIGGVAARRGGGALSLYLHVDSIDPVHAACTDADAKIIEPLWDPWWGGRQFAVADPDGNWWTVYQSTP